MTRIAVICLAIVLMLTPLMGVSCSGDDGTTAIKDVINDVCDAYNQGDYARALTYCINYGNENDAIGLMTTIKNITGSVTVQNIENITIGDSTATATGTFKITGATDTYEIKLVKIDGGWKVDLAEFDF